MKILIDNSGLLLGQCGIKRYAEEIIFGLQKQLPQDSLKLAPIIELKRHPAHIQEYIFNSNDPYNTNKNDFTHYEIFASRNYKEIIKKIEIINGEIKTNKLHAQTSHLHKVKRELHRVLKNLILLSINQSRFLKNRLKDITIYHQLFDYIPKNIKSINNIKRCLTVHDIIQAIRPDLMLEKNNSAKVAAKIKQISNDEIIFTNSQFTKDDLCNFHKKINPDNVHVTHLGIAKHFAPTSDKELIKQIKLKYRIPQQKRLILSSFTSDPKKNVAFTINNFLNLIKSERINDLHLVLTGGNSIFNSKFLQKEIKLIKKNNNITLTGFVTDDDMAVLLSASMCYSFPSLYEGFGLPVLEAMQCGAPVITSNVSSLPEIAGDAAIFIDPLDNDAFQNALLKLYKNSGLRKTLSEKGKERATLFPWDKCISKTLAVYNQLS